MIRKSKINDIEKLSDFYDNVIIYLDKHINYPKWKYKIYPSIISVTEMTKQEFQYIYFDDENNIIGAFVLNNDPEGSYHKCIWSKNINKFMVIHAFAVNPNNYGKHIGTEMLQFAINKAKELGFDGIRLDVVPENYPAKKFYENNGFKYVADIDLEREIEDIPLFSLYELYF